MTGPHVDLLAASRVGARTQEALSEAPGLNAWLFTKLAPHVRGDVLEIGSGIGNISRAVVARATTAVLSDLERPYLEALERAFGDDPRVTVAAYDLEVDPPPEVAGRRFDAIVAVNVIEHIQDDHALVRRLAALLKPGGKLVVYVPACPFAYGSVDRALGHYRRYTPEGLGALLAGAGLDVERPSYMNLFGLLAWTVNGKLLRRAQISRRQLAVFERLMSLVRLEDRFRVPIGLGLYTAAQRPLR